MLLEKAGHPMPDIAGDDAGDRSIRVLIIDDDPYDREIQRSMLEKSEDYRIEVLEASCGEEAFMLLDAESPDCVLLDYRLPDMDGIELLRRIRNSGKHRDMPVIMMTGQGSETVAVSAIKLGAVNYFIKEQLDSEKLVGAVRNGLNRKLLIRKLRTRMGRNPAIPGISRATLTESVESILKAIEGFRGRNAAFSDDPDLVLAYNETLALRNVFSGSNGEDN